MSRQPYQRCNPVRDVAARKRWRLTKGNRCQACGKRPGWLGVHIHHIIRFRRSDEPCNLLFLCAECHDAAHDGRITLADACRIKRRVDPDEFDLARLVELRGQPIDL